MNASGTTKPRQCTTPRGYTLVEVLVVLSILSLMLAIIMPAVQAARESSRRMTCSNRLRQLGLACQSFITTHERFPPYWHLPPLPRYPVGAGCIPGTHASLLNDLGLATLSNQLDWDAVGGRPLDQPPQALWPGEAWKTPVPDFVCPSDNAPSGGNNFRASHGTTPLERATWFPGKGPRPVDMSNESLWGILLSSARPSQVTDGLSMTVLYSERIVGDGDPTRYSPGRDVANLHSPALGYRWPNSALIACAAVADPAETFSFSGWTWALNDIIHMGFNHVTTPNSRIPDCSEGSSITSGSGSYGARSWHPGGVNVVMADGATRFVSDHIDLKVWRALGSYYGAEILSATDF